MIFENIITPIAGIISICIFVVYLISFKWFFKSYKLSPFRVEKSVFYYLSYSTLLVAISYGVLALEILAKLIFKIDFFSLYIINFTDISIFGTIVIKPVVLLLGVALASAARFRYISLKERVSIL